jgi:acyl-CoA thioester hydrolase
MTAEYDTPPITATVRVRYAETDQMGVAYYSHYFIWFEVARSEFCRARGIDYPAMEADGLFLPVVEARCRYLSPARYDDELSIEIRPLDVRRRSIRFGYRILREDSLLAEGGTLQVPVSRDGKPCSLPPHLFTRFCGRNP